MEREDVCVDQRKQVSVFVVGETTRKDLPVPAQWMTSQPHQNVGNAPPAYWRSEWFGGTRARYLSGIIVRLLPWGAGYAAKGEGRRR